VACAYGFRFLAEREPFVSERHIGGKGSVTHPREIDGLRARVRAGWQPEFELFLEPDPPDTPLGNGCLSQWYSAPMIVEGTSFPTAEHYMMWRKAQLFDDHETGRRILANADPAVAKRLGREVRGFSADVWRDHRVDVVHRGSIAKFEQHPRLARYLVQTGSRVLAEASPVDDIWGIGFAVGDPRSRDPLLWTGLSLLGFILMDVRAHFARSRGG
jgi:ribA/ribD-fused uncharacterized protein